MPFIITFFAGCSTLIGYFFIYFKNNNNKALISSLGFASGVMFFISLFDLIPESIKCFNSEYFLFLSIILCSLFLILGCFSSSIFSNNISSDNSLYRVGIISMLAIIIHNVPEGIVTFLTTTNNYKLGIILAISLSLHNIPEGISISIPIYYSTGSKFKAFIYTFISGMSEFLGAIVAAIFLKNFNSPFFMGILYSFTSGIMIYISLRELLPSSMGFNKKPRTIISFILGIVFIYISILMIK